MKSKYLQEGGKQDKTKTNKTATFIDLLLDGVKTGFGATKKEDTQQMQTPSTQQAAQPQTDWGKMAYGDLSKTQIPSLATQPILPQNNTWKNNKTQYYQQGGQMGSQQEVQKFCAEMIEAGIIDEKGLQQLAQKQPETIQQLFAIWKQSGIDGVVKAIQETQKARYGAKLNRLKQLRKVK